MSYVNIISYLQYKFGDTTVYSIVNEEPNAEECKAKFRKQGEEDKYQINIRLSRRAAEEASPNCYHSAIIDALIPCN